MSLKKEIVSRPLGGAISLTDNESSKEIPPAKVLDEDEFVNRMERIIERDFFPDLPKLRAQRETELFLDTRDPAPQQHCEDGSLDTFLYSNTSEDNESFNKIMDKTRERHRRRYAWVFDSETKQLQLAAQPASEVSRRAGAPDPWGYRVHNLLMYYPEGTSPSTIGVREGEGRSVSHVNTRVPREILLKHAERPWKESAPPVVTAEAEAPVGDAGGAYTYLATPVIAPGVDASPLMTWGNIASTPVRLDADAVVTATPGPAFRMPDVSRREQIGIALSERASQRHRVRRTGGATPNIARFESPRNSPFGSGGRSRMTPAAVQMSPAARRLVGMAASGVGKKSDVDVSLRASYGGSTPSASVSAAGTPASHAGRA
eukprot:Opistho-2@48483